MTLPVAERHVLLAPTPSFLEGPETLEDPKERITLHTHRNGENACLCCGITVDLDLDQEHNSRAGDTLHGASHHAENTHADTKRDLDSDGMRYFSDNA